jgi:hypothetical protein
MTSPKGGGGNDINLAALWVPVMPETSKMAPAMAKAGEESRKAFQQGWQGTGGNASAEEMGRSFATQFMRSFNSTFSGMPVPQGMRDFMGSFRNETQLSERELNKLQETSRRTWGEHNKLTQQATQMQSELTRRTHEYNQAVERGRANPAERHAIIRLQQDHARVTTQATEAQHKYATATDELSGATGKATTAQNLMIGAVGGGIGAAVTLGVSAITGLTSAYVRLVSSGINAALTGFKELSHFVLQTGEDYATLSHQLELYTLASGDNLENLNNSAARVFGDMDSNADMVGKTIGILSQRLGMEAGPALEKLTYYVEELRGRFGQLDVEQFASGLIAFGIGADQADESLASLVQSARGAGTPVNDVIVALRTAAPTLEAAGMGYEQAAAFVAELTKRGLEARSMMTGLQTAQGEFSELGLTFSEGMKLAAERMQHLIDVGDEAGAQKLGEELFGTRRWAEAMTMMEAFSDIISRQPSEFAASADSLDHLIDNTQTLSEKWEEVKRQAQEALRPMGMVAVTIIGTALSKLRTMIDTNMGAITNKIHGFGLAFIDQLPRIKDFTADVIRLTGHAFDFIGEQIAILMFGMGGFARLTGALMSAIPAPLRRALGMEDFKNSIDEIGTGLMDMGTELHKMEVSDEADALADWVEQLNIDVPKLKDNWTGLITDIKSNQPPTMGPMIPQPGTAQPGWGMPGRPDQQGNTGPQGRANGSIKGQGSVPVVGPIPLPTGTITPDDLGGLLGATGDQGQAFNAEAWRPTVEAVVAQVAPAYGIKNMQAWVDALVKQIDTESKGNPNSQNPNDSNGRGGTQSVAGLLNFLGTTYEGANISGRPYMDPVGQIAAAIELVMRHGLDSDGGPKVIGEGHGFYQTGGTVQQGNPLAAMFSPSSADTVAAWLQPGEEVMNLGASNMFRPLLKWMNAKGFEGGGTVGGSSDPEAAGVNPAISYIADIASGYGLDVMSGVRNEEGSHHHVGEAGDFAEPGKRDSDAMLAFAMAMRSQFGTQLAELIYHDPRFSGMQIHEGAATDDSTYANAGDHHDHVHVAVRQGSDLNMSLGSGQLPGSTTTMSMGIPGMPGGGGGSPYGTPGFTGGYGAKDWEAQSRNTEAVREAKQRADDMDYELGQKRQALDDLRAEREKLAAGETDILGRPVAADPAELAAIDRQITDAERDLGVAIRERADQNGEIATAERKLAEGVKTTGGQQQEYQIPGASAFTQLGGGLVKGLAQGFGFGDIFGKAPWEWGIFKLLSGGLNWGLGTANAWADQIGQGKTGLTGNTGVPLPGWEQGGTLGLSGMLSNFGINLPAPQAVNNLGQPAGNQGTFANVSVGPNVAPGSGAPPGQGLGPPPGPQIGGDYQPINVINHGPSTTDIEAAKYAQNSRTDGAMGGLPK